MRTPTGLVAAALGLWGLAIGQLTLGLVVGIAFEFSRHVGPSPPVEKRLPAIVRACGLATLVLLGYVIATQILPTSLYTWLRWLPVVLLPLAALAQLAGGLRSSHLVRALGRVAAIEEDEEVDVSYAYAALALAAAGTGNGAQPWLYAGYATIVGWALLARLPRARLGAAAVMFVAAAAFGHAIHTGIWLLQGQVEEWSTEFFLELFAGKADPFRERTRIGDLGRIKLSDRILMRVEAEGARPASILLRESAFEAYRNGEWRSLRPTPRGLARDGDRWTISEGPAPRRLTVRRSIAGGDGLLALPPGARSVAPLAAQSVEVFPSGAVKVTGSHRFVAYTVAYDPDGDRDAPERRDVEVPANLTEVMEHAVGTHGLRRATPAESVQAVRDFFAASFTYSLDLGEHGRTLGDFLARSRKGHCEYFASATVMLLRTLGIPARYAAGYSAQEYSDLERAFVVRHRHAHAWVTAWVDGRWIEIDTTPSRWAELEGEAARGFFAPFLDGFSWALDRAIQVWIGMTEEGVGRAAPLGLAMLAVVATAAVGYGLARRAGRRGPRARPDAIARAWMSVEDRLGRKGHKRAEAETVREWVERFARVPAAGAWATPLARLADDYYRVRFDPAAQAEDAVRFIAAAKCWRPA